MKKYFGLISVILAGVCWGLISIFIRALTGAGFTSLEICLVRCIISAFALLIFLLITDKNKLKINIKDIWMFIGTGIISLTFFSYCYFNTIVITGAAVAVVLLYTSPAFVIIMSAIIFKERITKKKLISLVLTLIGCTLVAGVIGNSGSVSGKGIIFGLFAGFGYALYSVFGTFASRKYSALTVTFYTILFSTISLVFLANPIKIMKEVNLIILPYFIGVAIICTAVPYILYTYGLKKMDAGKAAILVTVEPLVGCLLGIFVWKETVNFYKLSGIILILLSVVLVSINTKKK